MAPLLAFLLVLNIFINSPQLRLSRPNLIPPNFGQLDSWIAHNMRDYANRKATRATLRFDAQLFSAREIVRIITVKKDDKFRTVTDVINNIPSGNTRRVVVFIGRGVYTKKVLVDASKPFVIFYKDQNDVSSITFDGNRDLSRTIGNHEAAGGIDGGLRFEHGGQVGVCAEHPRIGIRGLRGRLKS
ncbi:hypothetical protein TB2_006352 [Malus domestica]